MRRDGSRIGCTSIGLHPKTGLASVWIDAAAAQLPKHIYHCTYETNRESIERFGLLPATTLMSMASPDASVLTSRTFRKDMVRLDSGVLLRDQSPMPPAALLGCLANGLHPADWYALVNARVFFWVDLGRARAHIAANRLYSQVLYTISTERLLASCAAMIEVTPINVGYARRRAARRGPQTFVPLNRWVTEGWAAESSISGTRRPKSHKPAEVAVHGSISDFVSLVCDERVFEPRG